MPGRRSCAPGRNPLIAGSAGIWKFGPTAQLVSISAHPHSAARTARDRRAAKPPGDMHGPCNPSRSAPNSDAPTPPQRAGRLHAAVLLNPHALHTLSNRHANGTVLGALE